MKIKNINIIISKSEKILARADIEFEDHTDRGFKIIKDTKTNKDFVTPPSYFSGNSWKPLFKTTNKEDWAFLSTAIIKSYNEFLINDSLKNE